MICAFRYRFSAAHFYHQTSWSFAQNQETFGKCFTEYGHGHDYIVDVMVENQSSEIEVIDQALKDVVSKIDHQHLNFVFAEFKERVPTTENLAQFILKEMKSVLENKKAEVQIKHLRLFENPSIWVELSQ